MLKVHSNDILKNLQVVIILQYCEVKDNRQIDESRLNSLVVTGQGVFLGKCSIHDLFTQKVKNDFSKTKNQSVYKILNRK